MYNILSVSRNTGLLLQRNDGLALAGFRVVSRLSAGRVGSSCWPYRRVIANLKLVAPVQSNGRLVSDVGKAEGKGRII